MIEQILFHAKPPEQLSPEELTALLPRNFQDYLAEHPSPYSQNNGDDVLTHLFESLPGSDAALEKACTFRQELDEPQFWGVVYGIWAGLNTSKIKMVCWKREKVVWCGGVLR